MSNDEVRSCWNKSIYFSRREAEEAIDYEQQAFPPHDIGEPYPCRYCPWWHTGHIRIRRRLSTEAAA